jgi:hypothetical protein
VLLLLLLLLLLRAFAFPRRFPTDAFYTRHSHPNTRPTIHDFAITEHH